MKIIKNLNDLDQPLEKYDYGVSPKLTKAEYEVSMVMNYDENGNEQLKVYSTQSTGIQWCLARLLEGNAEFNNLCLEENKITSIAITTGVEFVALKSKPRGTKGIPVAITV